MSDTQINEDDSIEWRFYLYDEDDKDPRYSVWILNGEVEIPVFSHQPDEDVVWYDLTPAYGDESTPLSDEFRDVLGGLLLEGEGSTDKELPPWEMSFLNLLLKQSQTDEGLPEPANQLVRESVEQYE